MDNLTKGGVKVIKYKRSCFVGHSGQEPELSDQDICFEIWVNQSVNQYIKWGN